jgi:hypothetical protein
LGLAKVNDGSGYINGALLQVLKQINRVAVTSRAGLVVLPTRLSGVA